MSEGYRNILANKYTKETGFPLITDTDNLEELENEWKDFTGTLSPRQQRLSDDQSIRLWNCTNQEHYERLKEKLIGEINNQVSDKDDDFISYSFDTRNHEESDSCVNTEETDLSSSYDLSTSSDELDILKHSVDSRDAKQESITDLIKERNARQWQIDTNINMVIPGPEDIKLNEKYLKKYDNDRELLVNEYMSQLNQLYEKFMNQSWKQRQDADTFALSMYEYNNQQFYDLKKQEAIEFLEDDTVHERIEKIEVEYAQIVDKLKQSNLIKEDSKVDEDKFNRKNQHRRFNDTPYFTPQELIDLGVHGNDNFYCKTPDNDGLISGVKIPTWFDSYEDMCMDHIFEDYRKDWIETMNKLYSDYNEIKESNDKNRILARKQSILDLGWNPEIPFTQENRIKAAKRVSKILDETCPRDIFINMNDIEDSDTYVNESIDLDKNKPVFLLFASGKTPYVSKGIKMFTHSDYTHASISLDPELNEIYSFRMRKGYGNGIVKEDSSLFGNDNISVVCFFVSNTIFDRIQESIEDFIHHKGETFFDWRIFITKVLHIDKRPSKDVYKQVCSTFVDTVLKSAANLDITGKNIPSPGDLYNATKKVPNKFIELYNGTLPNYHKNAAKILAKLAHVANDFAEICSEYTDYTISTVVNENKQFPVEFDKDGNLIIYKAKTKSLDFGSEIHDSSELIQVYKSSGNIEGIKYELAKLWFLNDQIEIRLKKTFGHNNDEYKMLVDCRSICLNVFKTNLEYISKLEDGFNFASYYNSTPFSDKSIRISANTLKYTVKGIKALTCTV